MSNKTKDDVDLDANIKKANSAVQVSNSHEKTKAEQKLNEAGRYDCI